MKRHLRRFVELNTGLEDLYASRRNRISVTGIGDDPKAHEITEPSREHTSPLVEASTLAARRRAAPLA